MRIELSDDDRKLLRNALDFYAENWNEEEKGVIWNLYDRLF